MAAPLPPALKAADIQRFALRAAQLEKFRPIVSYWCSYHILQTILAHNLHTADAQCQDYAVALMDKLEAFKAANTINDAIIDDVAAKAYMENFAIETFEKAEREQREGKVGRTTADTFAAAGTFLDVLGIWGEVGEEARVKSKFAKFHALRIAKAIKAGKDPNESNPVVEEPVGPAVSGDGEEEELEAELRRMQPGDGSGAAGVYRPPTVESAPNSTLPSRPESTVPAPNEQPALPPPLPMRTPIAPSAPEADVSPIEPQDNTEAEAVTNRQGSLGGGYFPSVPGSTDSYYTAHSQASKDDDSDVTMTGDSVTDETRPPPPASFNLADFYAQQQPPTLPTPGPYNVSSPTTNGSRHLPSIQAPTRVAQPPRPAVAILPPPPALAQNGPPPGGFRMDDEATMAAQKHAKWAISALNFEDVGTAVRELRLALQCLGAG